MRRILKHIPNTITSMNLLCGVLGILSCLKGNVPAAFYLMLAASVFDFCDGLAARALNAYSPMGKELDSLADMVSFGVLPSVMAVCFAERSFLMDGAECHPFLHYLVVCSPVAVAVFSGLRLAKFNIDERQGENFIGLATPACAILLASSVCFAWVSESGIAAAMSRWSTVRIMIPVLSAVLSGLLVCEIPMFAMKIKKGRSLFSGVYGKLRVAFFAGAVLSVASAAAARLHFSAVFSLIFLFYIVLNLVALPFDKSETGGKK